MYTFLALVLKIFWLYIHITVSFFFLSFERFAQWLQGLKKRPQKNRWVLQCWVKGEAQFLPARNSNCQCKMVSTQPFSSITENILLMLEQRCSLVLRGVCQNDAVGLPCTHIDLEMCSLTVFLMLSSVGPKRCAYWWKSMFICPMKEQVGTGKDRTRPRNRRCSEFYSA